MKVWKCSDGVVFAWKSLAEEYSGDKGLPLDLITNVPTPQRLSLYGFWRGHPTMCIPREFQQQQ